MSATCRSCGAPVVWCETELKDGKGGKMIPLDADPERPAKALRVYGGNLIHTGERSERGAWLVRTVARGKGRYRSHFASCPAAKAHRKPKAK